MASRKPLYYRLGHLEESLPLTRPSRPKGDRDCDECGNAIVNTYVYYDEKDIVLCLKCYVAIKDDDSVYIYLRCLFLARSDEYSQFKGRLPGTSISSKSLLRDVVTSLPFSFFL